MSGRVLMVLLAIGASLIVGSAVALAETVTCDATPPCYGTPEDDLITGTSVGETINALGGDDNVRAGEGNDTVYGGPGNDAGETALGGEEGSDIVYGGKGNDYIRAGAVSEPAGSVDQSFGGPGNDTIYAIDGNVDHISCGKGRDIVLFDEGIDTVSSNCEILNPPGMVGVAGAKESTGGQREDET